MAPGKGFCQSRNAGHARAPRGCAASHPAGDHCPMPGLPAVQLCRLCCRRGLARLQEKPSPLSSVLHTSSRGMESREWRENLLSPPTPRPSTSEPTQPSATQTALLPPTSPFHSPPHELYPLPYKGRPQAASLSSGHWNPFPRPCM